jgi:hypothetical protein
MGCEDASVGQTAPAATPASNFSTIWRRVIFRNWGSIPLIRTVMNLAIRGDSITGIQQLAIHLQYVPSIFDF